MVNIIYSLLGFLGLLLLAVLAIAYFARVKNRAEKFGGAMNALMAKHTFETLGAAERRNVSQKAEEIFRRMGGGSWEMMERLPNAPAKFILISLGMRELGISPSLKSNCKWYPVRRLFVVEMIDPQFQLARERIKRLDNVDVSIWE